MAVILVDTLLVSECLLFRYRQSAEQQAETRHYYAEKAEKKRLKVELKKEQRAKLA